MNIDFDRIVVLAILLLQAYQSWRASIIRKETTDIKAALLQLAAKPDEATKQKRDTGL